MNWDAAIKEMLFMAMKIGSIASWGLLVIAVISAMLAMDDVSERARVALVAVVSLAVAAALRLAVAFGEGALT